MIVKKITMTKIISRKFRKLCDHQRPFHVVLATKITFQN